MGTRDEYAKALKSAALKLGTDSVMASLVSAVPFFALPIVSPLARLVVSKVLEFAINEGEMGAFFLYIDLRTSAQGRDFAAAALQNQIAQKGVSLYEKTVAEKRLKAAFTDLVRFDS